MLAGEPAGAAKRLLLVSSVAFLPARSGAGAHIAALVTELEAAGWEVTFVLVDLFRFRVGGEIRTQEMREALQGRFHYFDVGRQGPLWLRALTTAWRSCSGGRWAVAWVRLREFLTRGLSAGAPLDIDAWYPEELDDFLSRLSPNFHAVCVAYVFLSRALLAVGGEPLRVLDTIDLFSHRKHLLKSSRWFHTEPAQEARGLQRADRLLAISAADVEPLAQLSGKPVYLLGPLLPARPVPLPERGEPTVLLVGSDNPHNRYALGRFLELAWEPLRALLPEVHLLVVGPLAQWLPALAGCEAVGEVDDLGAYYAKAWLCVNPDQGGTGISIKSLEALGWGRPLLTTPSGSRGLGDFEGSFRVAELADFPLAAAALLGDRETRQRMQECALAASARFRERNLQTLREALRV